MFKEIKDIKDEPGIFWYGGYKFFTGKFEKINQDSILVITERTDYNKNNYFSIVSYKYKI